MQVSKEVPWNNFPIFGSASPGIALNDMVFSTYHGTTCDHGDSVPLFLFLRFISNRCHEIAPDSPRSIQMNITFWIIFNAGILVLLLLDLAVFNRGGRVIPFKQALLSTFFWIAL